MGEKAGLKEPAPQGRPERLIREALKLLEEGGETRPAFYLKSALALLEGGSMPSHGEGSEPEMPSDAFAHAVGAMTAILERLAKRDGRPCVDSIASAMAEHGREIASRDMGAALILDHWADIIREQGALLEPVGRRDN